MPTDKPFRKALVLAALAILVIAGALGTSWALPATVTQGQTIPLPTKTARPRPTSPPPTAAPPPSPVPPTLGTATEEPAAVLTLAVQADRAVAGPGDAVQFTVTVANVGSAAAGAQVSGALPDALRVRSIQCTQCATSANDIPVGVSLPPLAPGAQALLTVTTQVSDDAWPGQTLVTTWQATGGSAPMWGVQFAVELPWAELPATGAVSASGPRRMTGPVPR